MKIAIMNYAGKSPNRGGPAGYLNNLYTGAEKIHNFPDFLHVEDFDTPKTIATEQQKKKTNNKFITCIKELAYFFVLGKRAKDSGIDFDKYDLIHVHSSQDVYYLRKFCKYRGRIVLTSHRPEPYIDEGRPILRQCSGLVYEPFKHFYNHMEKFSYQEADGFIYPSLNAMSIYESFPGFKENVVKKPIEFVYTGCMKKAITLDKDSYRKKNNIPKDKFVVAFIGRHTTIKGYDRLVKSFSKLKREDIVVVCAGALSEIQYPKEPNWIELGYISDAQNLMNAADVVVIPNRNTYYDLVIVEALSTRSIVISSNTGGNIDISKLTQGLILFDNDNEESLANEILYVKQMSPEEQKRRKDSARAFYQEYGDNTEFAKKYKSSLDNLCDILL